MNAPEPGTNNVRPLIGVSMQKCGKRLHDILSHDVREGIPRRHFLFPGSIRLIEFALHADGFSAGMQRQFE